MDPIPTPAMALYSRRALSTPSNSSDTPVSSTLSTVIFVSIIGLVLLLGLFCFTRRRSVSDTGTRRVHHLRSSISSSFERQPANVSLPIRKYAKEEMGGDGRGTECCPVCLVEFEEGEEVKVVDPGCEHVFHPVCIDRWLVRRNTCPVCRSAVMGEETYWIEELEEGDEEDVEVTEESDGDERVEGEEVVNVENVVVNVESVVVSGEGEGGERGEGQEEVVVNVESVVLSGEMDARMNMKSKGAEEREGEVEVNLEGYREGGEGEGEGGSVSTGGISSGEILNDFDLSRPMKFKRSGFNLKRPVQFCTNLKAPPTIQIRPPERISLEDLQLGEGRMELEVDSTSAVEMIDDDKSNGEISRENLQSTQS